MSYPFEMGHYLYGSIGGGFWGVKQPFDRLISLFTAACTKEIDVEPFNFSKGLTRLRLKTFLLFIHFLPINES